MGRIRTRITDHAVKYNGVWYASGAEIPVENEAPAEDKEKFVPCDSNGTYNRDGEGMTNPYDEAAETETTVAEIAAVEAPAEEAAKKAVDKNDNRKSSRKPKSSNSAD